MVAGQEFFVFVAVQNPFEAPLLEFAVGGNPWVSDATNAVVQGVASGGQFLFQFQERNALGNVARRSENYGDLLSWTNMAPSSVGVLQNSESARFTARHFQCTLLRNIFASVTL